MRSEFDGSEEENWEKERERIAEVEANGDTNEIRFRFGSLRLSCARLALLPAVGALIMIVERIGERRESGEFQHIPL